MIRTRANVGDTLRVIVPNTYTLAVLPPGTVIEVTGHIAEQPSTILGRVIVMPAQPEEYHIVVPKGSTVTVHEE